MIPYLIAEYGWQITFMVLSIWFILIKTMIKVHWLWVGVAMQIMNEIIYVCGGYEWEYLLLFSIPSVIIIGWFFITILRTKPAE
ncbi:MAG: hypothetical protein PHQ86_09260 [Dehalococcoidales bacterium]|nr:hypothetical protein [Dehalococcoidales bacterium]